VLIILNEIKLAERLARIESCVETLNARQSSSDALIMTIHELASDIKLLAQQVKTQSERIERIAVRYESKLKEQSERIGALEKEPAYKWKLLISQVITIIAAVLIGSAIGTFTS